MQNQTPIREIQIKKGDLAVSILNLGATISKIVFPERSGKPLDLALGYDMPEQYLHNMGFFGVTVGRCTNRIANARFVLNGQSIHLTPNAGPHHIHGGAHSFALQFFDIVEAQESEATLRLLSPDGQDGYPGNLSLDVTYRIQENGLHILYNAVCDQTTVVNLTNHTYFNLNGKGSILNQEVYSPAAEVCFSDPAGIPIGHFDVSDTPFDFRKMRPLDTFQKQPHAQIEQFSGYDHHFLVPGNGYRHFLTAKSKESGIRMDVFSTQEGFQLYTANSIHSITGKGQEAYEPYCGFCVETQTTPNAVNHPMYRTALLPAGETYQQKTVYAFSVER